MKYIAGAIFLGFLIAIFLGVSMDSTVHAKRLTAIGRRVNAGMKGRGVNKAICNLSSGKNGVCSSTVDSSGGCTCVAP